MHGHWLKGYLRDGKEIEGGGGGSGGGGVHFVTYNPDDEKLTESFNDLKALVEAGNMIAWINPSGNITECLWMTQLDKYKEDEYYAHFNALGTSIRFFAQTPDERLQIVLD